MCAFAVTQAQLIWTRSHALRTRERFARPLRCRARLDTPQGTRRVCTACRGHSVKCRCGAKARRSAHARTRTHHVVHVDEPARAAVSFGVYDARPRRAKSVRLTRQRLPRFAGESAHAPPAALRRRGPARERAILCLTLCQTCKASHVRRCANNSPLRACGDPCCVDLPHGAKGARSAVLLRSAINRVDVLDPCCLRAVRASARARPTALSRAQGAVSAVHANPQAAR